MATRLRILPSTPLAHGAVDALTGRGRFPWRAHFDVVQPDAGNLLVARVSVDSLSGSNFHVEASNEACEFSQEAREGVARRLLHHVTRRQEVQ